jgi:DNA-directed RNA polymerase specialized sigma subunit
MTGHETIGGRRGSYSPAEAFLLMQKDAESAGINERNAANARAKTMRNLALALRRDISTGIFSTDFTPVPTLWKEAYTTRSDESADAPVRVAPLAKIDGLQLLSDAGLSDLVLFRYGPEDELKKFARTRKSEAQHSEVQTKKLTDKEIAERVQVVSYRWKEIPHFEPDQGEKIEADLNIIVARALRAREDLFYSNRKLVFRLPSGVQGRAEAGLFKAIDYYDWRSGYQLSTLAVMFIKQELGKLQLEETPEGFLINKNELIDAEKRLREQGEPVTWEAVVKESGLSNIAISNYIQYLNIISATRLDEPIDNDTDTTFEEIIPDSHSHFEEGIPDQIDLGRLISELPWKEQLLLHQIIFEGWTVAALVKEGIYQNRSVADRSLKTIFSKLKSQLTHEDS